MIPSFLLLAAGCNTSIPPQLENFDLKTQDDFSQMGKFTSTTTVEALEGERDYRFTVTPEDTALTFDVHTPGNNPLNNLDGMELSFYVQAGWDYASILIEDAEGLVYAGDADAFDDELEAFFGHAIVSKGAVVESFTDDGIDWTFYLVDVHTDDGTFGLLPGEAEIIRLGGVSYRFTTIAAYDREPAHWWTPVAYCGGGGVLSYELLRVEDETRPDFVERPSGLKAAASGCAEAPPEG